jgi:hypothetical protein
MLIPKDPEDAKNTGSKGTGGDEAHFAGDYSVCTPNIVKTEVGELSCGYE